jgi:hypothetical protein
VGAFTVNGVVSFAQSVVILGLGLAFGGCFLLLQVPHMVKELSDMSVSGVEYFHYQGQTKYQERYRVRYLLDPAAGKRYRVVVVAGKVLDSSWENVAPDLAAGASVWGTSWQGRSEGDVLSTFGPPTTATDAGDVRTLWYMRRPEGSYGVVFRSGRLLAAFRTTDRELNDLLARKPPY